MSVAAYLTDARSAAAGRGSPKKLCFFGVSGGVIPPPPRRGILSDGLGEENLCATVIE